MSFKNFFGNGDFLLNLKENIDKIKKRLNLHGNSIEKLKRANKSIIEYVNFLKNENQELKKRINSLEDKLWSLKDTQNIKNIIIPEETKLTDKKSIILKSIESTNNES